MGRRVLKHPRTSSGFSGIALCLALLAGCEERTDPGVPQDAQAAQDATSDGTTVRDAGPPIDALEDAGSDAIVFPDVSDVPWSASSPRLLADHLHRPIAITTNETNVFWTLFDGSVFARTHSAEGEPRLLGKFAEPVYSVAADETHVYVALSSGLRRVRIADGLTEPFVEGRAIRTVQLASGIVAWSDSISSRVGYKRADASEPGFDLVVTEAPTNLAFAGDRLFWTPTGETLWSLTIGETKERKELSAPALWSASALAASRTHVAWVSRAEVWIWPRAGGAPRPVGADDNLLIWPSLAINESWLFWGKGFTSGGGFKADRLFASPVEGGLTRAVTSHRVEDPRLTVRGRRLFWIEPNFYVLAGRGRVFALDE